MIIIVGTPCQCGCGCLTEAYVRDYPHRGGIKGQPARFLPNHGRAGGCVSNEPLRQAFQRLSVSAYEVAMRMDWYEKGCPDSYRVNRALGLVTYTPGHGYSPMLRRTITPDVAKRLADAMGLLPCEIGL